MIGPKISVIQQFYFSAKSGLEPLPIMEDRRLGISYVDQGLLASPRGRMEKIEASMWIEKAWAPKLQRENNGEIMERFAAIQWITKGELEKVNAVRLYLRVIIIADLAHPSGGYIPDGMLTGDWQADWDLEWPHQPCP